MEPLLEKIIEELTKELTDNSIEALKAIRAEDYERADYLKRVNIQTVKNTGNMILGLTNKDITPHLLEQNEIILEVCRQKLYNQNLI